MSETTPTTAAPASLRFLAAATGLYIVLLAARGPVPSEDGVSYLWMASRFCVGRADEALALVFPPGFPLLLTPLLVAGLSAEWSAVLLNATCTAMTLWPVFRLAERVHPRAGIPAALMFASGSLLLRVAAEGYSEPPFLLVMAWGTWWGCQRRWLLVGAATGIAFWIRPEGLLLAASFVGVDRAAFRALVPAAMGVLTLAAVRWFAGHGFDPLPIHAFHQLRDDLPARGAVWSNLLQVPGAWLEAFGLSALLPFVLLVRRARAGEPQPLRRVLWLQVVFQVMVVCTFVVRRRFFLSCAVPAMVLAGGGLARLPKHWRRLLSVGVVAAGLISAFAGGIDANRRVERELGAFLGPQLLAGERVLSDLPRVLWFAGQEPLPPRHFSAAQFSAMAAPVAVRFVVLSTGSRREAAREVLPLLAADFVPLDLPAPLDARCAERGLTVLRRR